MRTEVTAFDRDDRRSDTGDDRRTPRMLEPRPLDERADRVEQRLHLVAQRSEVIAASAEQLDLDAGHRAELGARRLPARDGGGEPGERRELDGRALVARGRRSDLCDQRTPCGLLACLATRDRDLIECAAQIAAPRHRVLDPGEVKRQRVTARMDVLATAEQIAKPAARTLRGG